MLKKGDLAVINDQAATKGLRGLIVRMIEDQGHKERVHFVFVDVKSNKNYKVGEQGILETYKLTLFLSSNRNASYRVLKQD